MSNLGKYKKMPPTFEKLLKLEMELEEEGYSLDNVGLILQSDFSPYDATPYDVIPFASIGIDGIHFGLLTDFGTVTDLENAFVVCISPMDFGSHIKIVARNMKEFICLVCTMKSAVTISNFNNMNNEEAYINLINELNEEEAENNKYTERANQVVAKLKATIQCDTIDDAYDYVEKKVATARKNQTILSTLDGIGITPISPNNSHVIYKLREDMEININEIQTFFDSATLESKLAFIRDAQFTYLIANEKEVKELVINEMQKLGVHVR